MSRVTLASWIISLTSNASSRAAAEHVAVGDQLDDEDGRVADHVAAVAGELLLVGEDAALTREGLRRPDHPGGHRTDELADPLAHARVEGREDGVDVAAAVDEQQVDAVAVVAGEAIVDRRRRRQLAGGVEAGRETLELGRSGRRVRVEVLVGVEHPAVEVGDGRGARLLARAARRCWRRSCGRRGGGSARRTARAGSRRRASRGPGADGSRRGPASGGPGRA